MPLFAVYALDKPDSLHIRNENRPLHLAWVKDLGGQVKMAGPVFADDGETMAGSLVVMEGETLADIRALADQDPYAKAGLFATRDIRPFKWLVNPPADL